MIQCVTGVESLGIVFVIFLEILIGDSISLYVKMDESRLSFQIKTTTSAIQDIILFLQLLRD